MRNKLMSKLGPKISHPISATLPVAIALIFGGCCSNVFTLEYMIQGSTVNVGNIVTLCQFLFVSIDGLTTYSDFSNPPFFLKPRAVPFKVYLLSVILFFLSSVANNSVFMFDISVPLHIIFRCSGTVITMIIGWMFGGKSYSNPQIFSAVLLTVGAIITSLYKDNEFSWNDFSNTFSKNMEQPTNVKFLIGLLILTTASILMSLLSLYNEWTYKRYGKHWRENVFYTHLLGLPLFLLGYSQLGVEFLGLLNDSSTFSLPILQFKVSKKLVMLVGNVITQSICIRGVNILASQTNALTVSVVLLVRKFVSLILSVYLFGNSLSVTGYMGTVLVFLGALQYSYASRSKQRIAKVNSAQKEELKKNQ